MNTTRVVALFGVTILLATGGRLAPAEPQQKQPSPWFVDHQSKDGSWPTASFPAVCPQGDTCVGGVGASDASTPASTAAVLMMLTTIGHSRQVGPFADRIQRGIDYLVGKVDPKGRIGEPSTDGTQLYNQALSVMALVEGYANGGRPADLQAPVQRAIDYLMAQQRSDGAWPYGPDTSVGDAALTVWALISVRSAELAGFTLAQGRTGSALDWLESTRDEDGSIGWRRKGDKGARPAGCHWVSTSTALRAGVAAVRLLYGVGLNDRVCKATGTWLSGRLPTPEAPDAILAYFGTLLMFQLGGDYWAAWKPAFDKAVPATIRRDGPSCARGTWDPDNDPLGNEGGRAYTSAFNMIASTMAKRFPVTPQASPPDEGK